MYTHGKDSDLNHYKRWILEHGIEISTDKYSSNFQPVGGDPIVGFISDIYIMSYKSSKTTVLK